MTDLTLISISLVTFFNIAGWIISFYKNGRSNASLEGKLVERIKNLRVDLDNVPCRRSDDYLTSTGELLGKVEGIDKRLERIEKRLNGKP